MIPKTLEANLRWRSDLCLRAANDEDLQAELWSACRDSCQFWINAFVWTFRQKEVGEDGKERPVSGFRAHCPFVTWLVQDEFIDELQHGIDHGHDVLIKKSREMGASWLCLTVIHHYWQFCDNVSFLEASRKEDLVDRRGQMDSLFEKHRYINRWQPTWLAPQIIDDKYMHLGNGDTGSTIDGESTNGDLGRGGRKTAILLDEYASVQNAEAVDAATGDTAACRIFNSTPKGPGTVFHKIQREGRAKILIMPWWRHPEKAAGARQILDENGRVRWTSPWHASEAKRRDRRAMAQEIDMDDQAAGEVFFDEREVERHRRTHVRPPLAVGDIVWPSDLGDESKHKLLKKRTVEEIRFVENGKRRRWRLWTRLVNGRPPQNYTYVFASDISNGSGSSNSVCSVLCVETNTVVAKFWDANTSPEDFAEVVAFAAVWFGGRFAPAYLIWENNGPGGIFGRKIVKLGFPHFYSQRIDTSKGRPKTPRWGWNSNNERKIGLLGGYREALAKDKIIVPCHESLEEALDYCFTDNGELIPGRLREEAGGGRALHGDHVIADALTLIGAAELPNYRERTSRPPEDSFAGRRERADRDRDRSDAWND